MSKSFKIILIIVVIAFAVLAGLFFLDQKKEPQKIPPILSVIGEILEINNNQVKIKAGVEGNAFDAEKDFLILTTATTTFSNMTASLVVKLEDIHKPILAQEGKLEDLKVGDLILAQSSVNLRKIETFTAVSVQVINTKKQE